MLILYLPLSPSSIQPESSGSSSYLHFFFLLLLFEKTIWSTFQTPSIVTKMVVLTGVELREQSQGQGRTRSGKARLWRWHWSPGGRRGQRAADRNSLLLLDVLVSLAHFSGWQLVVSLLSHFQDQWLVSLAFSFLGGKKIGMNLLSLMFSC